MDGRPDTLESAVSALGALAQAHRLSVFRELVEAGSSGLAAGALADRLAVPRSSLSFHLSNLKQTGLIAERRAGRSIIYTANFARMRALVAFLLHNCCAGDAAAGKLVEQFEAGDLA
ncbi:MAG: metalloregulator ArsR/SmtB family transcription factor [Erythrobacter sp.]|uniref:ArsR/SmtB family transcription factor n=1 Tax=Erythrobacter sp. TaxID=1042 RepID=UPI002606BC70|nr:metalloregulator ArsR/SmtB family transcription factor [Erythrobacter sp.]MDJ0978640.1 metalloregulator ArsR/SmtB family transcription factor [Erythrobacter sp.]